MATSTSPVGHRYGLVRVRENAESIAFYGGEASEKRLLFERLAAAVANYGQLLLASRNLQFFTSFYRCAAVVCMPQLCASQASGQDQGSHL